MTTHPPGGGDAVRCVICHLTTPDGSALCEAHRYDEQPRLGLSGDTPAPGVYNGSNGAQLVVPTKSRGPLRIDGAGTPYAEPPPSPETVAAIERIADTPQTARDVRPRFEDDPTPEGGSDA